VVRREEPAIDEARLVRVIVMVVMRMCVMAMMIMRMIVGGTSHFSESLLDY